VKKPSPFLAAAMLTALLAPAGAVAASASTTGPINLGECTVNGLADSVLALSYASSFTTVDGLSISFINGGTAPATSIDFLVRYGGRSYDLIANGSFASQTPVTQSFDGVDRAAFTQDAAQCSVRSATFADGTAWHAEII